MPIINLFEKKQKEYKYKKTEKNNNEDYKLVYNTRLWRDLRLEKLKKNPLCEMCEKQQKLKLAVQVHHIQKISSGTSIEEKKRLGFDINNLMSVCFDCHIEIHKKDKND